MTTIRELQGRVHALAREKGWWDNDPMDVNSIAAKLALVHSEVSEALECVRDKALTASRKMDRFGNLKPEGLPSELADVVIRVADLAEALGIDLQDAIETKHTFNCVRTHRHGGRAL